jgi:hypothetical protein
VVTSGPTQLLTIPIKDADGRPLEPDTPVPFPPPGATVATPSTPAPAAASSMGHSLPPFASLDLADQIDRVQDVLGVHADSSHPTDWLITFFMMLGDSKERATSEAQQLTQDGPYDGFSVGDLIRSCAESPDDDEHAQWISLVEHLGAKLDQPLPNSSTISNVSVASSNNANMSHTAALAAIAPSKRGTIHDEDDDIQDDFNLDDDDDLGVNGSPPHPSAGRPNPNIGASPIGPSTAAPAAPVASPLLGGPAPGATPAAPSQPQASAAVGWSMCTPRVQAMADGLGLHPQGFLNLEEVAELLVMLGDEEPLAKEQAEELLSNYITLPS